MCLRLELAQTRLATSTKLRLEWEARSATNSKAVDILHDNQSLWRHVAGPDPTLLFRPSVADLEQARRAAERLEKMLSHADDGLETFARECIAAVATLSLVEWEAIRREKFAP